MLMVRKRTGEIVLFDINRVIRAINKALLSCNINNIDLAKKISRDVEAEVTKLRRKVVDVEIIQDIVERKLMEYELYNVAKSYILYRKERENLRRKRLEILEGRETKYKDILSIESLEFFKKKYLHRLPNGRLELPEELFARIARILAEVEKNYGKSNEEVELFEKKFFEVMDRFEFLPSGRILKNLGYSNILASCTTLHLNNKSIVEALDLTYKIGEKRLGVGYALHHLPPADFSTNIGPVGFIWLVDTIHHIFSFPQGFAAAGILRVDHPDILEFIHLKHVEGSFPSFNLSVALTDEFLNSILEDGKQIWKGNWEGKEMQLRRIERDEKGKVINIFEDRISVRNVLMEIAYAIWNRGEPGIVFIDNVNKSNFLLNTTLEVCDSCGEQYMLDKELAVLGSINLSKFVNEDKEIDWTRLAEVVSIAVRMLDNAIDLNNTGLEEFDKNLKENRRIGLGIMGFAEMLIKLGISYNSKKAIEIAREVMKFISEKARKESYLLALEKGTFPNWHNSIWRKKNLPQRNLTLTSISPTGSLALIANTSYSIEPLFSLIIEKVNPYTGERKFIVNPYLEEILREHGLFNDEILEKIAKNNSLKDIDEIPDHIKKVFITSLDVNPRQHILIQAAFQEFVDNAISKTCNLPADISVREIYNLIIFAWKQGIKGITFYRAKSRSDEVIVMKEEKVQVDKSKSNISPYVRLHYEKQKKQNIGKCESC